MKSRLGYHATVSWHAEQARAQARIAHFQAMEFEPKRGNLTLLLGTGGVKVNVAGNLLLSGSMLVPLTDAGLRSRVTTVIGLDYAF